MIKAAAIVGRRQKKNLSAIDICVAPIDEPVPLPVFPNTVPNRVGNLVAVRNFLEFGLTAAQPQGQ